MIQFTKLHGNSNDFIVTDKYNGLVVPDNIKPVFAEKYCSWRFGIDADGVIFLSGSA